MSKSDYSKFTDEELVTKYTKTKDDNILSLIMFRYHNLISQIAAPLFLYGADREDLMQYGRIGLYSAVESFDEAKNPVFMPFAKTCIYRSMFNAMTAANRKKHGPLNESYSLDVEDEETGIVNMPFSPDPEDILMDELNTTEMLFEIENSLSSSEKNVLLYLLEGYDYKQIAKILDREVKSVDNALQRIRSKVNAILKKRKG